eukprot:PhM_4_TR11614/c4_g1_i5/m.9841/K08818/CDC2L; cell division cycle 2-like
MSTDVDADVDAFLANLKEDGDNDSTTATPSRDVLSDMRRTASSAANANTSAVPKTATATGDDTHLIRPCRSVDIFKKLNTISEGSFGRVYRAEDTSTTPRTVRAIKQIKTEWLKDQGFPYYLLREINVLLSCDHPNIVRVHEVCTGPSDASQVFLVMEYVQTDLKYMLKAEGVRFDSAEVKCIMHQLLRAVAYLHHNWIVHRDFKTSNLLLNDDGVLKVCDFGLARHYSSSADRNDQTPEVCTMWYRAPEALFHLTDKYGPAMDMWSIGIIFHELVTGLAMFCTCATEAELMEKAVEVLGAPPIVFDVYAAATTRAAKVFPTAEKHRAAPTPSKLRDQMKDLMSPLGLDLLMNLLNWNPADRLTAEEALQHPYFTHEEPKMCSCEDLRRKVSDSNSSARKPKRTRQSRKQEEGQEQNAAASAAAASAAVEDDSVVSDENNVAADVSRSVSCALEPQTSHQAPQTESGDQRQNGHDIDDEATASQPIAPVADEKEGSPDRACPLQPPVPVEDQASAVESDGHQREEYKLNSDDDDDDDESVHHHSTTVLRPPPPKVELPSARLPPIFILTRPPPPPPTTTTAQTQNNGINNSSLTTVSPPRAPQVHRDGVAMPFIAREFDHRRVQEFHLAPADAELLAACPTPCHITVSRPDVQHLIVLDLDNVPDFFLKCDLAQRDLSRAIGGVRLIPSGTLVFCFYNDVSRVRLPSLTAGTDTFYHLLENKMLEMDQATAKKKNSADMALAVSVGRLTMMTPKSVPITIISEDSVFDELIRRSDASRKFMRFTRYLSQGLATPDMYNTHLDFFHHLHMRLLGKRVDLSVRHTKAPFNSVDYTMARTVSSQVATTTEHGVLKVVDF